MKRLLSIMAAAWLLCCTAAPAADSEVDKNVTYSIHVASFKNLKNANMFVNALQEKGKVVFWKGTQVEQKGYFYRIFTGRYDSYAAAEKAWRRMKARGQVSYKGIFSFRELLSEKPPVKKEKAAGAAVPATVRTGKGVGTTHGRFVDNRDGTVTDRENGLMWIQNGWHRDFFSAATWEDAIEKCSRFRAAGYTDWTLPTRAQWESLLDERLQAPAIVEPNPFRNVIIHMPYWAKDGPVRLLAHRYTTLLYTGRINHQQKNEMAFIWPVRVVR